MKKTILLILGITLSVFSCKGPDTITGKSVLDTDLIRGFTHLKVYRNADILGYVSSDSGEDNFNFKVWEGIIKQDTIKQTIKVSYKRETVLDLNLPLKDVLNLGAGMSDIKEIEMELINPTEYTLENPSPALQYVNTPEFLSKQYIGAMLKVKKIKLSIINKSGKYINGEGMKEFLKPNGKYSIDTAENATYFANNAFIGYKLFTSPKNAASLTPFKFVYQFLHNEKGKKDWKLLDDRGVITNKDALKIRVQASHSCYVYIFNIDSKGSVSLLFPDPQIGNNPIKEGKIYNFPSSIDQGFMVDDNKGTEEFLFMIFREEKKEMEELVDKIARGDFKAEQFRSSSIVSKTEDLKSKGVGGVTKVKVSANVTTPGFEFKTNQIQGLPTDFRETFILEHK